MGSAATVASANLMERLITVSKTLSPKASTRRAMHLPAVQGAGVVHRGEDAVDLQARVEPVLDLVDGFDQQRHRAQREELADQRDDHAVGGGQALTVSRPSEGWQSIRTTS